MREMRPNSVETGHGPVIETDQTPANLMVASAICSCAPALLRGSGDLIERAYVRPLVLLAQQLRQLRDIGGFRRVSSRVRSFAAARRHHGPLVSG